METLRLTPDDAIALLARRARAVAEVYRARVAIGIAGGPGAGKSTLAGDLVAALGKIAALIPMDGFHMRQAKLEALGMAGEKGAPHTFEGAAFADFVNRLKQAKDDVSGPGYSRAIEDVVDEAYVVPAGARLLVIEGNYLLLDDPPWDGLRRLIEFAVFLDLPRDIVRARLLKRHAEHGRFTASHIIEHVDSVDLPDYELVARSRGRADLTIELITES